MILRLDILYKSCDDGGEHIYKYLKKKKDYLYIFLIKNFIGGLEGWGWDFLVHIGNSSAIMG